MAPAGFRLSDLVHVAAHKHGKEIVSIRLDDFAQTDVERIKSIHGLAGTLDEENGRAQYVISAEGTMDESRDFYRNRVP